MAGMIRASEIRNRADPHRKTLDREQKRSKSLETELDPDLHKPMNESQDSIARNHQKQQLQIDEEDVEINPSRRGEGEEEEKKM